MKIKMLVVLAVASMSTVSLASEASTVVIKKPTVIHDQQNRSLDVVQVMRENLDGSFTILKIEPEKEVIAFFNRACKEEFGPDAKYMGLVDETRISAETIYSYSCIEQH
ncbi:hypothetical protein [Litoribrevibacter albus]|uniref:Uncharacterized protein n=1 Tax=Litoribrevibacter albus TaxID=1473156 RepID=A0AA37S796_9GAMM|nr:hypothetical protein [Litoribrevibacter albus]GLQ30396.1 hypothetical protein GCM10007876_08740 [Litoribrevibacter albus]